MLGYWQRPEATAETLAGGELHTGNLGFLDADGELHIRDRKSLVIIRGGANVYPAEVERVLHEAPGVAAAVLGLPDERLGERVVAVVELGLGAVLVEEDLRALCRAALPRYKVPERIVVVASMPRNAMGKVVRTQLPNLKLATDRLLRFAPYFAGDVRTGHGGGSAGHGGGRGDVRRVLAGERPDPGTRRPTHLRHRDGQWDQGAR